MIARAGAVGSAEKFELRRAAGRQLRGAALSSGVLVCSVAEEASVRRREFGRASARQVLLSRNPFFFFCSLACTQPRTHAPTTQRLRLRLGSAQPAHSRCNTLSALPTAATALLLSNCVVSLITRPLIGTAYHCYRHSPPLLGSNRPYGQHQPFASLDSCWPPHTHTHTHGNAKLKATFSAASWRSLFIGAPRLLRLGLSSLDRPTSTHPAVSAWPNGCRR